MQDGLQSRLYTTLSQSKGKINIDQVLFDSQYIVDLFCNALLLKNIQQVNTYLDVYATPGKSGQTWQDSYNDTVWFYTNGISHILSLPCLTKCFHISYDSRDSNCFTVWKFDVSPRRFNPGPRELYFCNLREITGNILTTLDPESNISSSAF